MEGSRKQIEPLTGAVVIRGLTRRQGLLPGWKRSGRGRTAEAVAWPTPANVAAAGSAPLGLTDLGDGSIGSGSLPDDVSLGVGQGSLQSELRLSQDSLRTLSE